MAYSKIVLVQTGKTTSIVPAMDAMTRQKLREEYQVPRKYGLSFLCIVQLWTVEILTSQVNVVYIIYIR